MRKLLYIFLFFAARISAQTYDFRNYNVDDGLAQSQVYCIYQDSRGYMWFGTNGGGASKFDGKTFQTLTTANGGLSNYIYSITEDKNQNLYFSTYDGLQIKGNFKDLRFDSTNGLSHNAVYNVLIDKTEKVWIGTQKGVCFLDENKKAKKLSGDATLEASAVWTIYQDSNGDYWFGTMQNGACHYSPNAQNKFTWYSSKDGLGSNFIRSFNDDNKGDILIGTLAGLYKYSKNKIEMVEIPGLLVGNMAFTSISKDKNQNMWFGTNEGAVKVNGLGSLSFKVENGLCSNIVLATFIDNEGDVWFGSDGAGTSKLASEAISNLSVSNGLPGDYINCIYQAKNKKYWFGIGDNGLVTYDLKSYKSYKLNPKNPAIELVDNHVNCIAEDEQGQIWAGTMAGLSVYSGTSFKNYLADNQKYRTIYSIYHTQSGVHYIGSVQGLMVFNDGKITPVEAVSKLVTAGNFAIYGIVEDNRKTLWLATSKGVVKYDGVRAELLNSKNKLTDKIVYNVVKDKNGNLWFGSEEGVFYYDHKEFRHLSESEGLASNQAYFLLFDNQNRLWIGTNKGIDALNVTEYVGNKKTSIKHYGKEEGLQGLECNFNSACKDSDGKLWFGTVKGITTFNPRFEKINYHEPSCSISDIKISFEKIDLSKYSAGLDSLSGLPVGLELPYGKNHVTFDFIGISQTNPGKVQYQFKLEGVDDDWVPPANKNEVTYSSLQPGDYTFYLKAMNNDGFWNKEPVQFKFKVLPPWYRTWWFYTLCVVIALVSIYAWNSYKTQKLRADKLKLEKEVQLRTHELREEKEKVEIINKEVIEQKAVIEHKNHEITDSIKYAKNIQEALLPAITGLQKDFPDSFVLYMPKDIVSGDFYWFTKREGKNYFAAADCTGHGVPGAFMSIVGNSLLTEIISEQHVYQPAEILTHLHVGVKAALNQNKGEFERRDGMDIALCAINKETLVLDYAGANRALWIYRKDAADKAEIIKPDKFPIGGLEFDFEEKRRFTHHAVQLQKGDCVYVFSDGYADQFGGPKGKKFMVANLQRALAEISIKPMKEQYEHLAKIFNNWRGVYEQVDDVLVIGVRV
ncbi:MAG TPA: two-component regulator propeller domain-containing protein [Bacteroidia bacterium]|jgi:ligand-binding sensor domain-containing protein/serine phosphatase RsbU (regulator of sigma subunit)|nr:two-component regulator propeller domain-containing protein [Bacteroidia bacterium]